MTYTARRSRNHAIDGMNDEDRRAYHRMYDRRRRAVPISPERQERMNLRVLQIAVAAFPEVLARGTGVDWQAKQQRKDSAA